MHAGMYVCMCVCVCVCVCVCACVRARARVRVRACLYLCACVLVRSYVRQRVRASGKYKGMCVNFNPRNSVIRVYFCGFLCCFPPTPDDPSLFDFQNNFSGESCDTIYLICKTNKERPFFVYGFWFARREDVYMASACS